MGGGGSSNTQTIQKSDPWTGQQPYLTDALSQAYSLYHGGAPMSYYPGQTYAPMSDYTRQGLEQTAQIAQAGSPTTGAANNYLQTQLNAGPDPMKNPYLAGAINQAQNDVMSKVNAQFAGSNYGSSAHEEWLARKLQEAALPTIAQAYQQNQTALNQASAVSPGVQAAQYAAPAQLAQVGTAYQNEQQQAINDQMARYNFNQSAPWDMLNRYTQAVMGGNFGSSSQSNSQTPYYTNPLSTGLGLGLGGLSMYNAANAAGLLGGGAAGIGAASAAGLAPFFASAGAPTMAGDVATLVMLGML